MEYSAGKFELSSLHFNNFEEEKKAGTDSNSLEEQTRNPSDILPERTGAVIGSSENWQSCSSLIEVFSSLSVTNILEKIANSY